MYFNVRKPFFSAAFILLSTEVKHIDHSEVKFDFCEKCLIQIGFKNIACFTIGTGNLDCIAVQKILVILYCNHWTYKITEYIKVKPLEWMLLNNCLVWQLRERVKKKTCILSGQFAKFPVFVLYDFFSQRKYVNSFLMPFFVVCWFQKHINLQWSMRTVR